MRRHGRRPLAPAPGSPVSWKCEVKSHWVSPQHLWQEHPAGTAAGSASRPTRKHRCRAIPRLFMLRLISMRRVKKQSPILPIAHFEYVNLLTGPPKTRKDGNLLSQKVAEFLTLKDSQASGSCSVTVREAETCVWGKLWGIGESCALFYPLPFLGQARN